MAEASVLVATIPGMISEEDLAPLRASALVEYLEIDHLSEDELSQKCCGHDVLMLNYDVVKKLSSKFYGHECVRRLVSISTDITGMDWASPTAARESGVVLQNIPQYSTESVAETVLCEVLLHSRRRLASFVDMIKGRDVEARMGINLRGRRAGVIGHGHIGSRVAELLSAVGMEVSIWNRSPQEGIEIEELGHLFSNSKVLCLCAATQLAGEGSNVGMIGGELLNLCQDAIIINLAGENLVNNTAMVEALQVGRVIGYSVERSPTTLASDLTKFEQVHLPPKNAWLSQESLDKLRRIWVENTASALAGKPLNTFGGK